MTLRLDWCTHKAAAYACRHWHYSRSMPASTTVKIGVWEDRRFVGAIVFARGAQQHLGKQFGLTMFECCELCRVALEHHHKTPVTRILSIALKMLKRQSPGVRLVISYADCDQDHHGGIYAGGGWIYLGKVQLNGGTAKWRLRGKVMHGRTVGSRFGPGSQNPEWLRQHVDPKAEKVFTKGKHKYAMPLDDSMRKLIAPLAQPYPKRAGSSVAEHRASSSEDGGSNPTPALSTASHGQTQT